MAARADAFGRRMRLWMTAGPGLAWIILFLLIPSAILLAIGFFSIGTYGNPQLPLTIEPFREVAGYSILGWSPGNLIVIFRSLLQAVLAAGLTVLLAYPLVFFIIARPPGRTAAAAAVGDPAVLDQSGRAHLCLDGTARPRIRASRMPRGHSA